jgi:hypothetical protein
MATKRQRRKRRRRSGAAGQSDGDGADKPAGRGGRDQSDAAEAGSAPLRAIGEAGSSTTHPVGKRSHAAGKGPPQAPWGGFPLSEVVVLIALILLIAGFFVPPPRGAVMLGAGLVLGSLAGLELAIREHFAGYRSHTLLLAGAVGIAVVVALYFLGPESLAIGIVLACGLVAFAAAAWLFARAFSRRSGGSLFRVRGD